MTSRMILPAALLLAATGCSRSLDFERMRQQRTDSHRAVPAGTIPYQASVRPDAAIAGAPDSIARGLSAYRIHCAVCHGDDGSGQSVMASNIPGVAPPSLLSPAVKAFTPDYLFAVISQGKNRMPGYAWAMPEPERWALVAYVRTLR